MFDLESLIGFKVDKAKEKLEIEGFKNVVVVLNSEHNDKCDEVIVCAVREQDGCVTLICGEFFMNLKG